METPVHGEPRERNHASAGGTPLATDIVTVLGEHDDDVLACLLPMLRAAGQGPSKTLRELAQHCQRRLTAITERPARADDDWSVPWSGGCGCELCGTLGKFLAEPSQRTLEWPLAESRRKHVRNQIRAAELPVRHETWKFGSPHTTVSDQEAPAAGPGPTGCPSTPPANHPERMAYNANRRYASGHHQILARPLSPAPSVLLRCGSV